MGKSKKRKVIKGPARVSVEWARFAKVREKLKSYLTPNQAEQLAYDLGDLSEICINYHLMVDEIGRALNEAPKDASRLNFAMMCLWGELTHIQWHVPSCKRLAWLLQETAGALPKLSQMTERENTWYDSAAGASYCPEKSLAVV